MDLRLPVKLAFFKHFALKKDDILIFRLLTDLKGPQSIMTHNHTWPSERNMTERRPAKFPLHKNIKPVLSPHLDSSLFVH